MSTAAFSLEFATVDLKTQEAIVVVRTPAGQRRRVELRWQAKGGAPLPPTWWESAVGELAHQDSLGPNAGPLLR